MSLSSFSAVVSVIIPAYNMGEYIRACIDSIVQGDFENLEVIVVDDGSTDQTQEVVRGYTDPNQPAFDDRVTYIRQENRGKSRAVNRGIERSSGKYLTFVDADDQLTPHSISSRVQAIHRTARSRADRQSASQDVDLVIGAFEVFDASTTYGVRPAPSTTSPSKLRDGFYLRWKTPFHLNACLISRELVEEAGLLDESLHRCIDGDYALRILDAARSMRITDAVVYRYRKHRAAALERISYRIKTARYRPGVVWKNYEGWRKWVAVPFGLMMDGGKLVYEIMDNYRA
ncbi:glycosyltransferase [Longibacter sp.]|uniref:glycosyltransferase n=1 Tax=Longibacter sp. TaxID=2045415 RepID=UPI003EC04830